MADVFTGWRYSDKFTRPGYGYLLQEAGFQAILYLVSDLALTCAFTFKYSKDYPFLFLVWVLSALVFEMNRDASPHVDSNCVCGGEMHTHTHCVVSSHSQATADTAVASHCTADSTHPTYGSGGMCAR
eukprot:3156048-Prymnesium_polylepis.1